MQLASIKMEEWGTKLIVSADFHNMKVVSNSYPNTYVEAIDEMIKLLQREKLRHESHTNSDFNW